MFDRFTERARCTMSLARDAAMRAHQDYIESEHILLGLLAAGDGTGVQALRELGADPDGLVAEVERGLRVGSEPVSHGQLPFTPRSKATLEHALEASQELGHSFVGTEHLLLGLLRERGGPAATVLGRHGITAERAEAVVRRITPPGTPSPASPGLAEPSRTSARLTDFGRRSFPRVASIASELGHPFLGTGHMLLALLGDPECDAARALASLGVTPDSARAAVIEATRTGSEQADAG